MSMSVVLPFLNFIHDPSVAAVAQELLVLGVFIASFILWRRVNNAAKLHKIKHKSICQGAQDSPVPGGEDTTCFHDESRVRTASAMQLSRTASPAQARASELQMLRLLEQREFTRALNMYRACERDGREKHFVNEELFSAFMQSAIRVGKIDVLERMLRAMKRNGLQLSLKFWQTTLKMLSSRKHFSACITTHALFGREIPADKVIYSCLINAALECGQASLAAQMLSRYEESGIDCKDHVLHFRTYVALGDVDAAEAIFENLLRGGDAPTTLMLNLLLLTCVNTKSPRRAVAIVDAAHDFESKLSVRIVDCVSYNTIIKGFAQLGNSGECFDCLHRMRTKGLEPDDITFGTLLDVCIAGCNSNATCEVVDLLVRDDRKIDLVMCTLFIKGFVRANCIAKALQLYREMHTQDGVFPDLVTYSVLIKGCVDVHELDTALQLVSDLRAAGHVPDDIILTHLLEGCRHAGNHALGKELFAEMLQAGIKPSEYTLITMVKLHGRCAAHEEAYDLVASWEREHKIKPSVIHFTCLMSGCLRTKNYDRAWAAYELMCKHGVAPDETTLATLLPGMIAAQQWDRCLLLVKRAHNEAAPITLQIEILNSALSQMNAGSCFKEAQCLQEIMKEQGIVATVRNVKRVF